MTLPPNQKQTARAFAPRQQNSLLPSRKLVPTSLVLLGLALVLAGLSVICYLASSIGQKTGAPRRNKAYYKDGR